jgi:hypothetical protein
MYAYVDVPVTITLALPTDLDLTIEDMIKMVLVAVTESTPPVVVLQAEPHVTLTDEEFQAKAQPMLAAIREARIEVEAILAKVEAAHLN